MTVVIKTQKQRHVSLSSVMSDTFASYKKINTRTLEIASTPESYIEHGDTWSAKVKEAVVATLGEATNKAGVEIGSWEATENADGVPIVRVEFNKELSNLNGSFVSEVKDTLSNMSSPENPYIIMDVKCLEGDQFGGVLAVTCDVSKIKDSSDKATTISVVKANLKALMRTKYRIGSITFGKLKTANSHFVGFQAIY